MAERRTERGTVLASSGNLAKVEIRRTAACEGCKACFFSGKKSSIVLPAANDAHASAGDIVAVRPPEQKPAAAFVMLFAVPLIALIVGALTGYFLCGGDAAAIAGACVGLAVGLIAVTLADRFYYSKKYISRIVDIIEGADKDDRS